jgi:hypothetical protein
MTMIPYERRRRATHPPRKPTQAGAGKRHPSEERNPREDQRECSVAGFNRAKRQQNLLLMKSAGKSTKTVGIDGPSQDIRSGKRIKTEEIWTKMTGEMPGASTQSFPAALRSPQDIKNEQR